MTEIAVHPDSIGAKPDVIEHPMRAALRQPRVWIGGGVILVIFGLSIVTLPWTLHNGSGLFYDNQYFTTSLAPPSADSPPRPG